MLEVPDVALEMLVSELDSVVVTGRRTSIVPGIVPDGSAKVAVAVTVPS